MRIIFSYMAMQDIVDFALQTLRERSPVGSGKDKHPGLYRDSHTVFLNGHIAPGGDVKAFRPGDQINIANPVPYSRKIEAGRQSFNVPGHVYEDAALIVAQRFGNRAAIKFTFMPVRFGDIASFASFSRRVRPGRKLSEKARRDWLVRQPALEIRGR